MKIIFYIFSFLLMASLAMWLLWQMYAWIYHIGWMLIWLGLLALVFIIGFSLIKSRLPKFKMPGKKPEHKVKDVGRKYVYAFRQEPELKDIVMLTDELHVAQLELTGDVIQLDNDTTIRILEDTGGEAVKVEIKGTKEKEKVFWVPRESIYRAEQYKSDL